MVFKKFDHISLNFLFGMSDKALTIRCVFLSTVEASRGKLFFLVSLTGQPLPEDYEPTMYETFKRTYKYKGGDIKFQLWDTSGQEEYEKLRPMSYAKCDVAVLVCSLNSKKSLNGLEKYVNEIKEYANNSTRVLIGLQLDPKYADEEESNPEPVSDSEMEEWAKKNGITATLKHTVKSGENVDGIYDFFAENYIATHPQDKGCNIA